MLPWRARLAYLLLALGLLWPTLAGAESAPALHSVEVHVFWAEGCPHCEKALRFLRQQAAADPKLRLHLHETGQNPAELDLLVRLTRAYGIKQIGVPLILIGNEVQLGYADDASSGARLRALIDTCRASACLTRLDAPAPDASAPRPSTLPAQLEVPLFGTVTLQSLSRPVLTVVLAAADGFNPCAMWVLVFLIGLLLNVTSRARRWLLGASFLLASAGVYFLIMAAWLNTLLLLGALPWLRLLIGAVAIGTGLWALRDFRRGELVCATSQSPVRRTVLERLRTLALSARLPLAMLGIALLACAVNVVELLCSAGIPAVYTQYLALGALPAWQHYLYLALYVLIFMVDDLLIFGAAMLTIETTSLGARYSRWSKLIGGLVMLILGLLMLLRPQWLM